MSIRFVAAMVCICCLTSIGCASLGGTLGGKSAAAPVKTYTVQTFGGLMGKQVRQYPMRDGLTVQGVLEQTGQVGLHRDFEIDVLRKAQTETGIVKMPVQFDTSKQCVKFETDYAIYADDLVVIRPVAFNPLEEMIEMVGPSK